MWWVCSLLTPSSFLLPPSFLPSFPPPSSPSQVTSGESFLDEYGSLKRSNNWRDNWRAFEGYTYNEPQQTVQSIQNMHDNGFIEYLPYKVKNRLY